MAFTYTDINGKHIFDVAEPVIQARSADGHTVIDIFRDGSLVAAIDAIKNKPEIQALTSASTSADIVAALKA